MLTFAKHQYLPQYEICEKEDVEQNTILANMVKSLRKEEENMAKDGSIDWLILRKK